MIKTFLYQIQSMITLSRLILIHHRQPVVSSAGGGVDFSASVLTNFPT